MTTKTLYILIGLPRSGKSTYAQSMGHPIVNPDSIRIALHGQAFIKKAEPFVWAIAHKMVESLFLAGHNDVVLDATNTTSKRRKEWLSDAWDCRYIYLERPQHICVERAKSSGMDYLIPDIERMAKSLELDEIPLSSFEKV